jgi:hypothetical protein
VILAVQKRGKGKKVVMLFGQRNRWRVSSICMIMSSLSGFSMLARTICKQTLHERCYRYNVSWSLLYRREHVLSQCVYHATSKRFAFLPVSKARTNKLYISRQCTYTLHIVYIFTVNEIFSRFCFYLYLQILSCSLLYSKDHDTLYLWPIRNLGLRSGGYNIVNK